MNAEEFWRNIDRGGGEDGCWEWMRYRSPKGYGRLGYDGKLILAHRLAYVLVNGDIPDGLFVCHRCDNPPCCNPAHLFLGTHLDNARDCLAKGRWGKREGGRGRKPSLSKEAAAEIRASYIPGAVSLRTLGERYGVSAMTVRRVVIAAGAYTSVG